MAPCLLRYSRCPKRALQFSLFTLIKLHLASHPLASSYSRVIVSSKICCLPFFLLVHVDWAPVKLAKRQTHKSLSSDI